MLFIAPDSARIYVNSSVTKQTRGGFAVGGLSDQTKGTASNFLFLTPENYFIGHQAGNSTTTGQFNSFIGYEAGLSNTEGKSGTFIGYRAGLNNTIGAYNTFIGNYAGANNTTGFNNIFIGDSAGIRNNNGYRNIFLGNLSGKENISGEDNVAIGTLAGQSNTTGARNIFMGSQAGFSNTTGRLNIFIGVVSGVQNTTGERNIFIGQGSGYSNQTASYNVFIGDRSGSSNTTGESNVFMGWWSGANNKTGHGNVYIGERTGFYNLEGSGNVFIGRNAGTYEKGSNRLYISNSNSTSPLIYGEFDTRKTVVNGSVKISEVLQLKPQSSSPGNPEAGDVYYDANSNTIKFFNGTNWMELNASPSASAPFVKTVAVLEEFLMPQSCRVDYTISSIGSSAIIESGIYYHTVPFFEADIGEKVIYPTLDIGDLSFDLIDLIPSTVYYVRSFAVNNDGVALGNMISFTTPAITAPILSTSPVIDITQTSATAGGIVTKTGGHEVTARGICWSTNPEPSISDNVIAAGDGLGEFTSPITGLTPETTYYVRVYATNSIGTAYGNEVVFETAPSVTTVTDIDDNIYNIVQIGTQTWMKENLKTTRYSDGSEVVNITDNVTWDEQTEGAYCWYNNDEATHKDNYGALYNFYAVTDSRNLCPIGWHVATYTEWSSLSNYLGGSTISGSKLKEEGTIHWQAPNTDADNSSGFTALPGGYRYGEFLSMGIEGNWWTSTQNSVSNASLMYLYFDNSILVYYVDGKFIGASVRCIMD